MLALSRTRMSPIDASCHTNACQRFVSHEWKVRHTCKVLRLRMWQEQPALVQQRCSPSHRYRPRLRHPVASGRVDGSVHMHNVRVQPVYTKGQCTHTQAHACMLSEGERYKDPSTQAYACVWMHAMGWTRTGGGHNLQLCPFCSLSFGRGFPARVDLHKAPTPSSPSVLNWEHQCTFFLAPFYQNWPKMNARHQRYFEISCLIEA